MRTVLRLYTENALWTKPARLQGIEINARAAGGSGSATVGGGGGAAILTPKRIRAADLPDTVAILIGAPGALGLPGGATAFGDIIVAPGGDGGSTGGRGGLVAGMRGGDGGAAGQPGGSVSSAPARLLSGGGGGAGSGSTGGRSGLVPAGGTHPAFWQYAQSGGGGNAGAGGGFPAGGGGAGALGAAGCLTLIEFYWEE